MRRAISTLFLAMAVACPSTAAPQKTLFDLFYERCLSSGPDFERTVALAKERRWTPLAGDMALSLTPVDNPLALEGWIVSAGEDGGSFEAVVVSKSTVGEKAVEGCTVASTDVDAEALEASLLDRATARPAGEERGQDRIHRLYAASVGGREEAITLSLPLYPNGSDQVVISVVAEQQWEN
jgi:hypothetical protein